MRCDIHCHRDEILNVAVEKLCLHLWICSPYVAPQGCAPKELNKLFLRVPWQTYTFHVKTKESTTSPYKLLWRQQATTFILKHMHPEFLQEVLNPPAEGHGAAHVLILSNVVLYKQRSRLRAVSSSKTQSDRHIKHFQLREDGFFTKTWIINNTYMWSSVRCEISSSFSLPKISNHSLLTDSPQLVSSRRSMFWSRSMSETRCAKRGTTTAWTRFHKVCLPWMEKNDVISGCQLNRNINGYKYILTLYYTED